MWILCRVYIRHQLDEIHVQTCLRCMDSLRHSLSSDCYSQVPIAHLGLRLFCGESSTFLFLFQVFYKGLKKKIIIYEFFGI